MPEIYLEQPLSDPLAVAQEAIPFVQSLFPELKIPLEIPVFSDLVVLGPLRAALRDVHREAPERFTRRLLNLHRLARWVSFHVPIIELSEGLFSALLLTDPASVDWDEVHPPFDTFVVRVPSLLSLCDPDDNSPVPVTTVWYHRYDVSDDAVAAAKTVDLALSPALIATRTDAAHHMLIEIAGGDCAVTEQTPVFSIPLAKWLNQSMKGRGILVGDVPATQEDIHLQLAMRRLYVNLCLYIAERGLGATRPRRRACRYTKRGRTEETLSNNWLVGAEIPFDQMLCDAAKAWVDTRRRQRAGWHVMKRTVVRGHWRNQACGLARAERRRIWIMPHPRGGGQQVGHLYTEKKRKERT